MDLRGERGWLGGEGEAKGKGGRVGGGGEKGGRVSWKNGRES